MEPAYLTWTSAMKSPARYEIYGGTGPTHEGWSKNGLNYRGATWRSLSDRGDRGVKVTFENKVTIRRFEASY